jgi:CheY-like chemotaxis protein
VHGIVAQSGGRIFVESAPGEGTSFAIAFPAAAGDLEAMPAPQPAALSQPAPATILVVEDDAAVRGVASAILTTAEYRVLQAGSGGEALAISDAFAGPIDLLLTDVVMQGPSGPGVALRMRERRAEMKILYTSGHAEELIARRGVLRPGVHFIAKPFTRATLLEKVRDVLASAEPGDVGVEAEPLGHSLN